MSLDIAPPRFCQVMVQSYMAVTKPNLLMGSASKMEAKDLDGKWKDHKGNVGGERRSGTNQSRCGELECRKGTLES